MTELLEEWKPVVGFENWYQVSNLGRIRTIITRNRYPAGLILRQNIMKDGYHLVTLTGGKARRGFGVHCLVAEAFIGARPKGNEVNHVDGDKSNNTLGNLEYVTPSENMRHAVRTGLRVPPQAKRKVTAEQVREIRLLKGRVCLREAADQYGVCKSQIRNIWTGNSWKHVA